MSSAYFTQLLNTFTRNYYQLLSDLDGLAAHPAVLVNLYYSPFGRASAACSSTEWPPRRSRCCFPGSAQLNKVLQQGADLFGFGVAAPRFTGHELCTAVPWVQGPSDPAPLHPNAAGELAIALADQQAFPLLSAVRPCNCRHRPRPRLRRPAPPSANPAPATFPPRTKCGVA